MFDAVRVRLIEIGEAAKALPEDLLAAEPDLPWSEIARMRDHLAHRRVDCTHQRALTVRNPEVLVVDKKIHRSGSRRTGG